MKFNSPEECQFQSDYIKILVIERLVVWVTTDKIMRVFKKSMHLGKL